MTVNSGGFYGPAGAAAWLHQGVSLLGAALGTSDAAEKGPQLSRDADMTAAQEESPEPETRLSQEMFTDLLCDLGQVS